MSNPETWLQEKREYDLVLQGAAHDLMSAFSKVKALAQLIARQSPPEPATLEHLNETMARADSLLRDLSAWRDAGNPVGARTESQLQLLVDGAKFQLRPKDVTIAVGPGSPAILGNSCSLEEVLTRILDNSIKFGASLINVTARTEGNWIHLWIADNGEGIPAEYAERVWLPFERLHGSRVPGSGLGLSICRRLVRREGGVIWSEAGESHGTTVHIRLPGVNSVLTEG